MRAVALTLALIVVSAASVAADVIVSRTTPHLTFTASLTPDVVKPGGRLSLVVKIVPKRRMHVYAPGTKYKAVTVTLNRSAWLKPAKTVYPKPSLYLFKPFNEQVFVYSDSFRLTMPIAIGTIPERTARVTISGTLSYQACDDRVCYLPQLVPLEWVVPVRR